MSDSGLLVELRVLVFFKGGHLLATYKVPKGEETSLERLSACADDAFSRTRGWPFLWLTIRAQGRLVYKR